MAGNRGHAGRDNWWGTARPGTGTRATPKEVGHFHSTPYPVVFLRCRCYFMGEEWYGWSRKKGPASLQQRPRLSPNMVHLTGGRNRWGLS